MSHDAGQLEHANILPLRRQRVESLLEDAVQRPLVILTAGSGHGKTQAVSSFVSDTGKQVIWIRLTPLENYAAHFWQLFAQAVATWNRELARKLESSPFPDTLPAMHRFLEAFSEQVYREERIILVFDDFHHLSDGPVKGFVENMIGARLENVSVILMAGAEVHINLVGEIHSARLTDRHLRFTAEELRIYYTALGILLTEEQQQRLLRLTDGWAFAVYMLGMRLLKNRHLDDGDIDDAVFQLFRLMDKEIFLSLGPAVQQALIQLSLLESFTLEMAARLTQLQGEALMQMVHTVPFLSYHPETATYYFHNLFRQFLQQKQVLLQPKDKNAFLIRAARWHEAKGLYLEAIRYAREAGFHDMLTSILMRVGCFHTSKSTADALVQIISALPEEYLRDHPMLQVIQASMAFSAYSMEKASSILTALLQELETRPLTEESRAVLGEANIVLAFISMHLCTYDFLGHFKAADGLLPQGSAMISASRLYYLGNGSSMIYPGPEEGGLDRMLEALFDSMPYAQRLLHGFGAGREALAAAETYYYQGELRRAEEYACQAVARATDHRQWDIACNGYYIRMRLCMAHGDLSGMEEHLARLRESARKMGDSHYFVLPDIAEGAFFIKAGLSHQVAGWIADDCMMPQDFTHFNTGRELVVRAGFLVSQKRYYEALAFIDSAMGRCSETGQWFSHFKLLILKALVYDQLEEHAAAAGLMETAWRAGHGSRIIMPFVEYGNGMRTLITHIRSRPPRAHSIPSDWLDLLHTKASTYAKYHASLVKAYCASHDAEPSRLSTLTYREREVLQLLCQGMTNEDIADKLCVQVSTVKGTLGRIYGKLRAINRADAVRIALAEYAELKKPRG